MSRGRTVESKIMDAIDQLGNEKELKKKAAWDTYFWFIDDVEYALRAQTFETAIFKFVTMKRAEFVVDEPRMIRIRGKQSHRKERTYECTLLDTQRFRIVQVTSGSR